MQARKIWHQLFFVLHHPGSPFTKSSPLVSAFGSFLAFLQPGSVHAEIVTENAMRRLNVSPTPVRMKLTRTSLSVRARLANLSYFSYATGIESMNTERSMLAIETNKANPVRPEGPTPHLA